jgi:hypothetical protein
MFKPSLFPEITDDCCLPSTKLDETIEAYPFLCKEWLTTELSYIKAKSFTVPQGLVQV